MKYNLLYADVRYYYCDNLLPYSLVKNNPFINRTLLEKTWEGSRVK